MLPAVDQVGAIVLNDVGALAIQEQIQLLEWLNTAQGRTQVVSTAPTLLLPRVKAGAFIDTLSLPAQHVCLRHYVVADASLSRPNPTANSGLSRRSGS